MMARALLGFRLPTEIINAVKKASADFTRVSSSPQPRTTSHASEVVVSISKAFNKLLKNHNTLYKTLDPKRWLDFLKNKAQN